MPSDRMGHGSGASATQRELLLFGEPVAFTPLPPGFPVLIYDTFTGADDDDIEGHVPDINTPGGAWDHVLADVPIQIQGNRLRYVGVANVNSPVWIDTGQADLLQAQVIIGVLPTGESLTGLGVSLRTQLNDAGVTLSVRPNGSVMLHTPSVDETVLDESAAGVAAVGDRLILEMHGDLFEGYVNGIPQVSITTAHNAGETGAGVRFLWSGGARPELDEFLVRDIT